MSVHLTDLTWPEVAEAVREGAVVVVPVGATEQHGRHLPLEVDWRLAGAVAEEAARLAREQGVPVLVTPPLWTGYSPHHMDFAGSITLDASVFLGLVGCVVRSLWHHGFRKILLLNGHGGNIHLLRSAVMQLRFEHGVRAAVANYWDLAADEIARWRQSAPGGINHACEMETSLMLSVRPELVRRQASTGGVVVEPAAFRPHSPYLSGDLVRGAPVTTAFSFAELTGPGHLGDAQLASAERGAELRAVIAARVADFLKDFHRWDWDRIPEI